EDSHRGVRPCLAAFPHRCFPKRHYAHCLQPRLSMPGKTAAISHQRDRRVAGRVVPLLIHPLWHRRDVTLLAFPPAHRFSFELGGRDQRLPRELHQRRRLLQVIEPTAARGRTVIARVHTFMPTFDYLRSAVIGGRAASMPFQLRLLPTFNYAQFRTRVLITGGFRSAVV